MKNKSKVIPKNSNTDEPETCLTAQASLQQLRAIWNDEHHSYSDGELIKIRDWLYSVARMVITVSQRMEKEYTLDKQQKIHEYEHTQSYPLCQSEYRRAS
jgi:hypothetical protein